MNKIIIDTDTAGDDTIAILTALHSFDVLGITITGGNVDFNQQIDNALYTTEIAGYDNIPVYPGYEGPIFGQDESHTTVEDVHGSDGMGDSFFSKPKRSAEDSHAIDFIIKTVNENPGEVTLLAIAPLTNIAMAIKKDPTIVDKVKHLYIMGGTNNALGNIVPSAEYNFYVDPEAAKLVLQSGIEMTMVGWDMCTDYSLMFDKEHEEIEALATKGSKFFTDVNRVVKKFNKEVHKLDGTTHPDTLLVAIAADEKIMSQSNKYFVDVETKGELTRGYSLVDINGRLDKEPNVRVCEKVDRERFKAHLYDVLGNIK
ncbi:nucleoside hydrolase [Jeotgalicoccus meleagridis]|uniref:Pyrimidine-specific ribonucleoside hydrolase RihB n=1 Tax=Jeotgalicoccus meleagridis TaxID=2759181 RepID=A0A6V7RR50_9STAP|nr:nucleoside hydrolase [Jeotgalicoccus meleagridis]CAD2080472.1 Pyrimidine-specific ribonucleoside hydrolase RihB [Jeotgalicoccus meleagridis]